MKSYNVYIFSINRSHADLYISDLIEHLRAFDHQSAQFVVFRKPYLYIKIGNFFGHAG